MGKIAQLDSKLSNLIAAGEVVESPYSVVKELVENSIDANSKNIEIILKDFGMSKIVIIDDGEGMDKDDVLLCFSRHATSKITNEFELFRIKSLGFRGEAIPSIASVSTMTVKSNKGSSGYEVQYKSGKLVAEKQSAANKGTTVTVENLFFNTPARLKYIKSPNYELAKITELMSKLAICFNNIKFRLSNDGKEIFVSNSAELHEIMASIYSLEVGKNFLKGKKVFETYSIELGLTLPHCTRSRKNGVTIIVNNRVILNNKILTAVLDGYRSYLEIGKYPIAVVKIEIDPLLVDVNVHPNKKEIRLSNESDICSEVESYVKELLNTPNNSTKAITNIKNNFNYVIEEDMAASYIKEESVTPNYENEVFEPKYQQDNLFDSKVDYIIENSVLETNEKIAQVDEMIEDSYLLYLSYLGQLSSTYLLFEYQKSLYLIDQHAAAERINYEYYLTKLANPVIASQTLLIPIILDLTKDEFIFLNDQLETLKNLGFALDIAGENSFYVREVPDFILKDDKGDVSVIISYLIEKGEVDLAKYREELAKSIACKASIKANERMSASSVDSLVTQLAKCDNPFTCPHGRPTVVEISNHEIEKMFRRKM